MVDVIGIRFKRAGKIYYFDPKEFNFEVGDGAIVETARGIEYGEVVIARRAIADKLILKPLKPVVKKADAEEKRRIEENIKKEKEAFEVCQKKIEKHKMDMKLINVEYTFDNNKIIFYFTADHRVDFRELVKDLASIFKTRIELRQIGVRDEAKMIGGLGPCGRPACCAVFLGEFQPVSIKMAKEQNLSLSPTKISGLCGRLMCCLNYEHEYYEKIRGSMPRIGAEVKTPDGIGVVVESHALTQRVKVKVTLSDETIELRDYSNKELSILKKGKKQKQEEDMDATNLPDEIKVLLDE